ncbi:hypothetical protein V6N13_049205 [Hibiscus sabdariffa]
MYAHMFANSSGMATYENIGECFFYEVEICTANTGPSDAPVGGDSPLGINKSPQTLDFSKSYLFGPWVLVDNKRGRVRISRLLVQPVSNLSIGSRFASLKVDAWGIENVGVGTTDSMENGKAMYAHMVANSSGMAMYV